jgi:hypothetical protein
MHNICQHNFPPLNHTTQRIDSDSIPHNDNHNTTAQKKLHQKLHMKRTRIYLDSAHHNIGTAICLKIKAFDDGHLSQSM